MFQSISWQQYIITLLIATILYYLFVWIFFFKGKLSFLRGLSSVRPFAVHGEDQPDEVMTTAQHVITEIRPMFNNRENKTELILALQSQLKKYNGWEEPGFRELINRFIASQSETICSIRLGDDDLRALWK